MKTATATLSQLTINPDINPRNAQGYAGLEGIIAQIREHGVIDHIWVRPAPKKKNSFEVIDGSRRLQALQALAKKGEWKKDAKIPVTVFEADDMEARDLALAANFEREALSPADEAIAFTRLFLSGMKIEAITARYAATERLVKQRIAIGSLPELILNALRAGKIDVGTAQMFTQFPAERALKVFQELDKKKSLRRYDVEEALADGTVSGLDPRCIFVGAPDYEAAGGTISRDLFGSNDLWSDEKLLDRLFEEKLETTAKALADEGWSFVEIIRKNEYQLGHWGRSKSTDTRELTAMEKRLLKERKAELEAAEAELNAINDIDEPSDAQYARDEELDGVIEKLQAAIAEFEIPVFTDRQKAKAGAVIVATAHGRVRIERGLIKPSKATRSAGSSPDDDDSDDGTTALSAPPESAQYSEALTKMLEEEAQKATKVAMVMHKPMLTYRMGLAARIMEALNNGHGSPFDVHHRETVSGDTYDELRDDALKPFDRHDDDEERDLDNQSFSAVLSRLEVMSPEGIITVEAYLAADLFSVSSLRNREVAAVISLIDPDMTTEGFIVRAEFLEKLNKVQLMAIAAEIKPDETIAASIKKADLVTALEPSVIASGWLPAVLRTPSYKGPGSNAWVEARDAKLTDEAIAEHPASPEATPNLQAAE